MDSYIRKIKVLKVIDGDTIEGIVDLGYYVTTKQRIRLSRIDTPELNDPNPDVRVKAIMAKSYAETWLSREPEYFIRSEKSDSFGRWLGEISDSQGISLNQQLLDNGLAEVFKR